MSDDLQPITINLNANKEGLIGESFLQMFGQAVKNLLGYMFKESPPTFRPTMSQRAKMAMAEAEEFHSAPRAKIVGTPIQIAAFGNVLSKEKKYMDTFLKYGLNDPQSFKSHAELDKAVANFERETGIKWPLN